MRTSLAPSFSRASVLGIAASIVCAGTLEAQVWGLKASQKVSETQGGFGGVLDVQDYFGWSMAALGDLDGDGVPELAVGTPRDDDGGADLILGF